MRVQLIVKPKSFTGFPFLALPVFEGEKLEFDDSIVRLFLKDNPKFGKAYETQELYTPKQKILLVGAGQVEKFNFEICQNWAGTIARSLLLKTKEITILPPKTKNIDSPRLLEALILGLELAIHDPSLKYKTEEIEKSQVKLKNAQILVESAQSKYQDALKKSLTISRAINLARTLGDLPANDMTPTYFLNMAKKVAKTHKLKLTVTSEKTAKKMGMGGFVGVSKGSDEPSFMIALEYKGDPKSKEKWGLVGKGLTFDSGGISIKPGVGMHEMKYDMSGAGAVLGAIQAMAELKAKVNVAVVCAVTENLPGGRALKPGDIVKTYSGKTSEVLNTDAEGRLVLVDALTFAQRNLKATKLIDLATLTGAMIVSLGDYITGVFGNNPGFSTKLIRAGALVGERYWELPMDEDYNEMIKSDLADMANLGHGGSMPGAAGSITGAKFLEKVIEGGRPWIHLDIAGTACDLKPKPYRGPGATGVGIKTLIELCLC